MVSCLFALICGLFLGHFYGLNFVNRYALLVEKNLQESNSLNAQMYGKRFIIFNSMHSIVRLVLVTMVTGLLIFKFKLNPIFLLLGFLFTFWYGVLSSTRTKGEGLK